MLAWSTWPTCRRCLGPKSSPKELCKSSRDFPYTGGCVPAVPEGNLQSTYVAVRKGPFAAWQQAHPQDTTRLWRVSIVRGQQTKDGREGCAPTLGAYGAILAIQVLSQVRDQANKFQFAILESCPPSARALAPTSTPNCPLREGAYIRVALSSAVAAASFLFLSKSSRYF